MQKLLDLIDVPWPVDFRSKVIGHQFIKKGIMCDPGDTLMFILMPLEVLVLEIM